MAIKKYQAERNKSGEASCMLILQILMYGIKNVHKRQYNILLHQKSS